MPRLCSDRRSRRIFLADTSMGLTGLALGSLLPAAEPDVWTPPDGKPHFTPKAKRVIWLFMLGGVSHVESFDPKPALNKYAGKQLAETPYKDALDSPLIKENLKAFVPGQHGIKLTLYPMQSGCRQMGKTGVLVSDWFPNIGETMHEKPLPFVSPGPDMFHEEQRREFEFLGKLNNLTAVEYPDDAALRARIKSYELAFRMQMAVPEVINFKDENEETQRLYGLDNDLTRPFGQVCLAARRLSEKGVRFVQIYHGGAGNAWDAHKDLKKNHGELASKVDKPIAGLLKDLRQRGLLDETIVVWATEFGRTPGAENSNGRDHHPFGFSTWIAGGGIK